MKRRITLGSALLAIIVIGLALAAVEHVRRDGERLRHAYSQLAAQSNATQAVITETREDLLKPAVLSRESRMGTGGSQREWYVHAETKDHTGPKIGLEVKGEAAGSDLRPIRIVDKGGELNAEIIKRLTDRYRKRGWAFVIEHAE